MEESGIVSITENVELPKYRRASRKPKWWDRCVETAETLLGAEPGDNLAVELKAEAQARSFRAAFGRYRTDYNLPIATRVYPDYPTIVYLVRVEAKD